MPRRRGPPRTDSPRCGPVSAHPRRGRCCPKTPASGQAGLRRFQQPRPGEHPRPPRWQRLVTPAGHWQASSRFRGPALRSWPWQSPRRRPTCTSTRRMGHSCCGSTTIPACLASSLSLLTLAGRPGRREGHARRASSAGTLGIGLGAIRRMAGLCDLYSVPGHGTTLVARFWPQPRRPVIGCAGLSRPIIGEAACGDMYGTIRAGSLLTGVLCDGLGHGPLAAAAASEALAAVIGNRPANRQPCLAELTGG
jgi:hypothetical protein